MKKRYEKINFTPPRTVQKEAQKGLELRKKFGRGGLPSRVAGKLGIGSGIVRASNLARGMNMSSRTIQRMANYFNRHRKDKRPGWDNIKNPTNGYIAWLLWGGDAGRDWANKVLKQMKKADEKLRR